MRFLKRLLNFLGVLTLLLLIVYLLGPSPATPVYNRALPTIPAGAEALEAYVAANESRHKIKPDNEARIIWANDSLHASTSYAIVYLHGFSASQEEGDPVHLYTAKTFGCNLYLSRLSEHGIDTSEQLMNLTPDSYWETAKQALAIGKQLGKKVILMGTSTGGTQALQLAASYPDDIAGLLLLSPNIAINDDLAWFANNRWGLQIARLVKDGNYVVPADTRPIYKQYWNSPYRLEAIAQLQEMLETTMTPATFKKISQPLLLMYYYKNERLQDSVVRVSAMLNMYDQVSTPEALKRKVAVPNAGNHVIGSYIKSGDVESVKSGVASFLKEVMVLQPAP